MADIEAEELARLSNVQLLNALLVLSERVKNLEEATLVIADTLKQEHDFLHEQILTARLETEMQKQKTPIKFRYFHKRVKQVEDSFQGFITWFHSEERLGKKKQIVKQRKGIEI